MSRATATVALVGVLAVAVVAVVGGGGSRTSERDTALTASEVETQLAAWVSDRSQRSKLTGVKCFERSTDEFGCVGDFHASRAYAVTAMGGVDASNFSAHDWKLLQERHSGRESYDVAVDATDGSFTVNPVGDR